MFNRKNRIQDLDSYVEERLSEYIDGTLSDQDRAIVEAHLAKSERARESLDSLRYTISLLKQTTAPALPRQFTLPVTLRAPAQGTPAWLLWGLRGVAVAATAAFVILLTATLLRQPNGGIANAPAALSQTQLPVNVALAPTALPYAAPARNSVTANPPTAAPAAGAAPQMITIEAENAEPVFPITETPFAAMSKALPTEAPLPTMEFIPTPLIQSQPTSQPNTQIPKPTTGPSGVNSDANAAGSSAPTGGLPALAPPTKEQPTSPNEPSESTSEAATSTIQAPTQRTTSLQMPEGVVNVSQLRVRRGPGVEYRAIGSLRLGERVRVSGRNSSTTWLEIEYPRALETEPGWVGATFLEVNAPLENLPVVEPPPLQEPGETPTEALPSGESKIDTPTPEMTGEPTNSNFNATPEPLESPTPLH